MMGTRSRVALEPRALIAISAAMAYAGVGLLQLRFGGEHVATAHAGAAVHWLRDGTLAVVPVAIAVVVLHRFAARHRSGGLGAAIRFGAVASLALAATSPLHQLLPDAGHSPVAGGWAHAVEVLVTSFPATAAMAGITLVCLHAASWWAPAAAPVAARFAGIRRVVERSLLVGGAIAVPALIWRHVRAGAVATPLLQLLGDGMTTWLVTTVAAAALLAVAQGVARPRRGERAAPRLSGRTATASALVLALAAPIAVPLAAPAPAEATEAGCTAIRSYDVAAIDLTIPYNRWGDADRNGMMYVLQQDKAAVKNWDVPLDHVRVGGGTTYAPGPDPAGGRRLRPRPLVLRANEGDCVRVTLTNELSERVMGGIVRNPRASITISGVPYDVQTSDGSAVGYNTDTTVARGSSITYTWRPAKEGVYLFHDSASSAGSQADGGSPVHGLFGALAVEPAGSRWFDPVSGAELSTPTPYSAVRDQSGELYIDARIMPPAGRQFRESIQLAQDEIPGIGFGFNYGSEPGEHRIEKAGLCPDCVGEETSLSSWVYGDPALVKLASGLGPWPIPADPADEENCGIASGCWTSNVTHAYRWDPIKIRYGQATAKETHVWHVHAHQWLIEPNDRGKAGPTPGAPSDANLPESSTVDSQTFGPGDMFTADMLYGAGSRAGTVGDAAYHCHLYPHFAEGMWGLLRVHDVREDGTQTTPDGVKVRALIPLSDNTRWQPPAPTADNPGFPRFIPGQFGWRAPQPPAATVTEGGPGGPQATRVVAGARLDPDAVALEKKVQDRLSGTTQQKPGAPFTDPCPSGAREVTYNISIIQRDVVYNEAGWHDTQGRIYVLDKDVEAVLAGTKEPEPLFARVQSGDCVNVRLTNRLPNWFGNDAFVLGTQVNMIGQHPHLVKFDVMASDGSSNGWNYQQAAFTKEQMDFNAEVLAGEKPCSADEAKGACRIPHKEDIDPSWSGQEVGQTIHARWYADYELKTAFTHDHHFPALDQSRGQYGALLVEPQGTEFRHPITGQRYVPSSSLCDRQRATTLATACESDAVGPMMDILGPGANDDFREFGLSFQDFVSLTKAGGNPRNPDDTFNPPEAPEHYPDKDPGVMGINYRNAPFVLRDTRNGAWVDPAYRFSSTVFGDPKTPLLQAYARDRVRIRLIGGAQEEQHVFALHGMRWREEPDDPQSPLVNARALGVSDALNFQIPEMECGVDDDCRGDYLYSSTSTDATYLGMWGIMRVFGRGTKSLLPLPDNIPQAVNGNTSFNQSGSPPPMANKPGTPCPTGAPTRQLHVFATDGRIDYNAAGDHDPYGLMYGLVEPGETVAAAVARVRKHPEPLVIRANEGDCLEVRLTNKIDPQGRFALEHAPRGAHTTDPRGGDPRLPLEPPTGTRAGLRVSLHPSLVRYDVRGSDGATIGYNRDQTVGPDQSILYRWWADDVTPGELGAINLVDFGDVRGHRHHGLFAGLVIEPKGATTHDPVTGARVRSGAAVDVRIPGEADFREFVPFFQDGLNLRDKAGRPIEAPGDAEELDSEDEGEKGFNYRSEAFRHRLGRDPADATSANPLDGKALSDVFSSKVHGDPGTPIFRAYAGDPVRVRVLQGADKPRQHVFRQAGHEWIAQPHDPGSTEVGSAGGFSVGRAVNAHLPKAGGALARAGDYKYFCSVAFGHQSGGLWGITRVYNPPPAGMTAPTPLRAGGEAPGDDPRTIGYHPIQPLERAQVSATVFRDSNLDLRRGNDEGPLRGVEVQLRSTSGQPITSGVTDADGNVSFPVTRGAYDLVVRDVADFAPTTPTTMRVDATAENADAQAQFGLVQLGDLEVLVFNDKDGDSVVDPGESPRSGWSVTLSGERGPSRSAATGADGNARFDGLLPGTYEATVAAPAGWAATRRVPVRVTLAEDESRSGASAVRIGHALDGGLSITVFNDANRNGRQDPGESGLGDRTFAVAGGPDRAFEVKTGPDGVVRVSDPAKTSGGMTPGTYTFTQRMGAPWAFSGASGSLTTSAGATTSPQDWRVTPPTVTTTVVEETTQVVSVANTTEMVWVVAEPFNDLNNDGVRQDGEHKLVGWRATAHDPATGQVLGSTTTANDGRAVWQLPTPTGPGTTQFRVRMTPREVPDGDVPYTATSPADVTVSVIDGETATASFGFVQLGTVSAYVWHDLDRNGHDDGHGEPLANRTVRLFANDGKTLLQQKTTDASGIAAFATSVGVNYQLEVLLPSGWTATAPFASNGTPVTKTKVTGPTGTQSIEVDFGQYNTNDRTPPPDPTFSVTPGTFPGTQTIALSSESGASFRYTLDGDLPTGTTGMTYQGPITVSSTKTLTAVAIDTAGNVSGAVTGRYVIDRGSTATTAAPAAPQQWTTTVGTTRGDLSGLHEADDGRRFFLVSAASGKTHVTDGFGTYTVPSTQRKVVALGIAYEGSASMAGVTRQLELYNWSTKKWEVVRGSEAQTVGDMHTVVDVAGDPLRFMDRTTGQIRLKVRGARSGTFELGADKLTVTVTSTR